MKEVFVNKKVLKLQRRFRQDNNLGFPFQSKIENSERKVFITKLMNTPDFVKTYQENDLRAQDSAEQIIKNFNGFNYFIIGLMTILFGSTAFFVAYSANNQDKAKQESLQDLTLPIIIGVAGLFIGLAAGFYSEVEGQRVYKKSSIDTMYNRVSVRLFKRLRENYPDLRYETLRNCNPEMARVIAALLIANMSKDEVKQMEKYAVELAKMAMQAHNNEDETVLREYEYCIGKAQAKVSTCLRHNPALANAILNVYRGNIPAQFHLKRHERQKD